MQYPDFDPASADTPLDDAELQGLDELLQGLPVDGAMTLDGMDGYLTALLVGPPLIGLRPTADWLPAIWGGDPDPATPAPFASNQKKKRTTVLVLRHLQSLACALRDAPAQWEPIFSIAELPGTDGRELADATDWATGFLQATDLAPEGWQPLFADPALGPLLAPIALLGGDPALAARGESAPAAGGESVPAADLDDPEVRDALSRAATEAVLALWARRGASL